MTTMHQRQRMRDRAAHLSLVSEADARSAARDAAASKIADAPDNSAWQDTQPRQLTHEELRQYSKHPYIPAGCHQQGRVQPAEAATEIGADATSADSAIKEIVAWVIALLMLVGLAHGALTAYQRFFP